MFGEVETNCNSPCLPSEVCIEGECEDRIGDDNCHWERDEEGVIHFDPAESLETYHQAVNPLAEIAGIQSVVKRTLTLPEHLTTCRQRQDWQRLL